ncbi:MULTISPECIES: MlaD family protein [unclassified Imperialibacter]|uniref:MlaD family protein n=1 Tax=unclassified Imperialibacter TaxID=2629706 RepID=UPI0012538124|nr:MULTISPECIES: MlaD family protein [unclassified Imperialibacter]CAD5265203.1 Phospholipid/cholesterol/gamma-HCH transport system substrate-binding protein [Imperialibacter sp. 89]CAD5270086.1 Phospholipid/cholesterol/gamma-HCH transport system substrate-binding protein [Imperialibacter sp. 75]VVT09699.1 Phospholipid/cholesterol/gamma-HCH transport system substrate-binding protein [Imperialibacter sp. EC-SDR9]
MKNNTIHNAKVGLFVIAGVAFLVIMLYMIGRNRNLFGSTFSVVAVVSNVSGLLPGNNVRFMGIDVGTVKSVTIANDTSIYVTMVIDNEVKPYIKKNAVASVGTDGLMGNKLINITSQSAYAEAVAEGDIISSEAPVETDAMLRTLNTTNQNIEKITQNLYEISERLNRSNSLWTLLSDTLIAMDFKRSVGALEKATGNAVEITRIGKELAFSLQQGDGLVSTLFTDTTMVQDLNSSLRNIENVSNETLLMMENIRQLSDQMKEGEGAAGLILADSAFREKLMNSALSLEQGTDRFNENMEALKSNFLFRRYFKKLEKQKQQEIEGKKE